MSCLAKSRYSRLGQVCQQSKAINASGGGNTLDITLNSRSRSILARLLESEGPVPVMSIAQNLDLTARMVRYQLADIEKWLRAHHARLERRPGKGVWIEQDEPSLDLEKELTKTGPYQKRLSESERIRLVRLAFLLGTEAKTTATLGLALGVSKTTVAKDLRQVRAWFLDQGLYLKGTPGLGMSLVGDELAWRKATLRAVYADGRRLTLALTEDLKASGGYDSNSERDILAADSVVDYLENALELKFSDRCRLGLITYMAVALRRIRLGRQVGLDTRLSEALRDKKEHMHTTKGALLLRKATSTRFPESEICHLTAHVLGADATGQGSVRRFDRDPDIPGFEPEEIAAKLVDSIEQQIGASFSDRRLYESIASHLTGAFYRLRFGLGYYLPPFYAIRCRYSELFLAAKNASKQFLLATGMRLGDDEISALTMFVVAAYERRLRRPSSPRVILVSDGGIAEMDLLHSRMKVEFPQAKIVSTLSYADFVRKNLEADVIISTDEIPEEQRPCVVVSPFLTKDDMHRLRPLLFCR